jgi:hypothetical protein
VRASFLPHKTRMAQKNGTGRRFVVKNRTEKNWRHPVTGQLVTYGYSTVESW